MRVNDMLERGEGEALGVERAVVILLASPVQVEECICWCIHLKGRKACVPAEKQAIFDYNLFNKYYGDTNACYPTIPFKPAPAPPGKVGKYSQSIEIR
jgi:hypothetical protein